MLRMVKQAWTLVLPDDWFLLRPLGSPGLCCLTGGTCMLWERLLLFPGMGVPVRGHTAGRVSLLIEDIQVCWPQSSQGPRSPTPSFSTSALAPAFSLTPRFCPSTLGAPSPLGFLSCLFRFPAAAAPVSSVSRPLLLMTFLSVFQIVSNKSIPRKRPREVALSTFQTFGFPIPFSLLPCSSCLSHLL